MNFVKSYAFPMLLCLTSTLSFAEERSPPQELGMPTSIPHAVSAYLPITIEKNACLSCHRASTSDKVHVKGEIPASHYISSEKLSGERYECMLCHGETNAQSSHVEEDINMPLP